MCKEELKRSNGRQKGAKNRMILIIINKPNTISQII